MYVFPLEVFCTLFVTLTGYQYKATHTDSAFNGTVVKSLGLSLRPRGQVRVCDRVCDRVLETPPMKTIFVRISASDHLYSQI